MNKPIIIAFILLLIGIASCKKEETTKNKNNMRLVRHEFDNGYWTHYFEYNEDGKVSIHRDFRPPVDTANPVPRVIVTEFFYGKNGKLSSQRTNVFDERIMQETYEYDSNDRLVRFISVDDTGLVWLRIEYTYGADDIEVKTYGDPKNPQFVIEEKYHLDANGNVDKSYRKDPNGVYYKTAYNTTYDGKKSPYATVKGLERLGYFEHYSVPNLFINSNNIISYTQDYGSGSSASTDSKSFQYTYNKEGYVTYRTANGQFGDKYTYETY